MSWVDKAVEDAKRRIAEEAELLKKTYSPDFAEYCQRTGLFFSFGDVVHLINVGLHYSISVRYNGGHAAGIACFESLIMRFKLYLIKELKTVLANEEPFKRGRGVDYYFIVDFLDQFKILDRLAEELKEIREREGGNYQ